MALLQVFMIPFAALNYFGAVGGLVLLTVQGRWQLLAIGVAGALVSILAVRAVLVPGRVITLLAKPVFAGPNWPLGLPFVVLGSFYAIAVTGLWCAVVTGFFVMKGTPGATMPALSWAYTISIAPLIYMAKTEKSDAPGEVDLPTVLCAEAAIAAMGITVLLRGFSPHTLIWAGASVVTAATLLHAVITTLLLRQTASDETF
jgi:hypothetical protein